MPHVNILENIALAPLTTMRVGGNARFFAEVTTVDALVEALDFVHEKNLGIFILGAGSNTIFSDSGFNGLVIKIAISGITYEGSRVTAGAGVAWDDLVRDVVEHNLWGIENLSLIPSSVGGAAVQNIGAYGVEARETIYSVDVFDIEKKEIKTFLNKECEFGYRESIFKKNKNFVVVSVTFDLSKHGAPRIEYEDVKKYFIETGAVIPSLAQIRAAIVGIRTKKMPQPPLGTAGSFFKNPIIGTEQYEGLKKTFPEIKAYPQGDNTVKLAAAWLLDHVGQWRGTRRGDAGVHENQALILVNYGSATASEMLKLADDMKKDIKEKTDVTLEEEVVMA